MTTRQPPEADPYGSRSGPAPPRESGGRVARRSSLWARTAVLGYVVAGVTALVAALVSVGLVSGQSRKVLAEQLSAQADVVSAQFADLPVAGRRVTEILEGLDVEVVRRGPNGGIAGADRQAVRAARRAGFARVTAGQPLHGAATVGGVEFIVEGRAVDGRQAIALVQRVDLANGTGRELLRSLLFALSAGIVVAAIAGIVLARLLARPLRRTADVAVGMRHGRRDLRVPADGPRELVAVGESINALADALAHSEARQREFLLSVSHELRTPLTAVRGFAESLADGVVTGDEVPSVGRTIEIEAGRLDQLVSDLLDLARLGADDFRLDIVEVDLSALLAESAHVWERRCAGADLLFRVESPGRPVVVRTDPQRVRQVVDGLASNAVRATPAGAPVVLALREVPGGAVLEVRDGGPGLSADDYRAAFQRGVLHSRYRGVRPGGTGIGLALVHGLVTRLGGAVDAGPAPEGGARFSVALPR
ncbi:HAMP domain-containing sensor histidine kinase [Actinophytocola glycyrrhizae]|uniref:Signal transduction histidine-protein kinase/phosphatase MprB n=1 Tax=Actinophytocola glycyrrhizae TaxID=2044873 RepID=A0ABV9RZX4_9PSEU